MLIRTQDKACIIDAAKIYIVNELGNKKFYVFAKHAGEALFSSQTTLGTYSTKQQALTALDLICGFFADTPKGIYQMP